MPMLMAMVSGRDTTSDSMTWTLYALLRHPHYLRRAISEFDSLSSLPAPIPNSDLLSHLPFFDTVISESLRLYPSVPLNLVDCSSPEPVVLPDGNVVEPDEDVLFSPWVMARLPEFWGPDADEFRPERWEDMEHKPSAYELPVFHAGPRSCLGQNLAKMEMAVTFKEMLTRYTFEMGWEGEERVMGEGITNPMLGGLPVRVRRRAKV
jgi:cytochrome P450